MTGAPAPVDADQENPELEPLGEEAETPQADPAARRLTWSRPGPLTALTVVVVVLASLVGWLGLRLHGASTAESDRTAAAAAAQRLAETLTTISASSSEQNIQKLLDGTTGSLKEQIAQSSGSLSQILKSNGVTSTGSTVQTGLTSLSGGRAVVLIAVDASVSSAKDKAVLRHYRMRASVTKVGDRWLVSDMEFVA